MVQVLHRQDKRKLDTHSPDSSANFFGTKRFPLDPRVDQVEEEESKVDEEGVPHHAKAESRPVVMAVTPEVEDVEDVCAHVSERHDCVEEPKEACFLRDCGGKR